MVYDKVYSWRSELLIVLIFILLVFIDYKRVINEMI